MLRLPNKVQRAHFMDVRPIAGEGKCNSEQGSSGERGAPDHQQCRSSWRQLWFSKGVQFPSRGTTITSDERTCLALVEPKIFRGVALFQRRADSGGPSGSTVATMIRERRDGFRQRIGFAES
jgi:hypothetical protein